MQHNEQTISVLNDLVRINYDRIRGWENAIEDSDGVDKDIKVISQKKINESRGYLLALQGFVSSLGGTPATDSTVAGKFFRVWMDFKATITGKDSEAIMNSCVFGENAAVKEYEDAIKTDAHLPDNIRKAISEQKANIEESLQSVKAYTKAIDHAS